MAIRLTARVGPRELRYVLVTGEIVVGADPGCDFVLGDPTVSRRHARVVLMPDDGIDVIDLDSRNGIEVSGRRLAHAQGLRSGSWFRVGDVEVHVADVAVADAEAATAGMVRDAVDAPACAPAQTVAIGLRQEFAAGALPDLIRVAAQAGFSDVAARALAALLMPGLPGARLSGAGGAVLASAGAMASAERSVFARAGLTLELVHDESQGRASLQPLAELVLDLLLLVRSVDRKADPARVDEGARSDTPAPPPGTDPAMRELYRQAAVVAGSRLNVLVEGESGTGKELFARYLHAAAGLPESAFVALNCAALPRDLLDAELFGIEAGVATGVAARPGCFEQAHGGTLFLDEIADMASDTQARLLRVLQEGAVYRIGSGKPRPAHARVISACNRPLKALVEAGAFRLDLYHRVADWNARLPPLRERPGDIVLLAGHFLERECRARGIAHAGISRVALESLQSYAWPGNVRELEREMLRVALFLNDGEIVASELLKPEIRGARAEAAGGDLAAQLATQERRIIRTTLAACEGNVVRAAEKLGVGKSTLYRRMTALGLDPQEGP